MYFAVSYRMQIQLMKQGETWKVFKRHLKKVSASQAFPDYDMARAYFTELIADYL